MSLPKYYKAAIQEKKGEPFKIKERPIQYPKDGQVLVKVLACGVCHSDTIVKNGAVDLPRVPGHEVIGDVVATAPSESVWNVGDRVGAGWHGGHDHTCNHCRSGKFIFCENEKINGINKDGGYAEYVLLHTEAILSVPKDMDPAEAAPLVCAGVTTFNSLRNMGLHPGDLVAVQGIGGLGHLAIQFARKMGLRTVALSSSGSKRALAEDLGAHVYLDGSKVNQAEELIKLGGAKVIACTAPNPEIVSALIPGVAPGGTLLLLAITPGISLDSNPLITKGITVRGWPSGTAKDSEETVTFSNLSGVKCRVERYKLGEAQKAFERMIIGKANFRCVIVP